MTHLEKAAQAPDVLFLEKLLDLLPGRVQAGGNFTHGKVPSTVRGPQGHATFSMETSKEKAAALMAGGRSKAGLCPLPGLPPPPGRRPTSAPSSHAAPPGARRRYGSDLRRSR